MSLERAENPPRISAASGPGNAEPWDSWPSWVRRDGTAGVPHYQPRDGAECPYLAMILCAKCGWTDPDTERVQRARELLGAARRTTEANREAL